MPPSKDNDRNDRIEECRAAYARRLMSEVEEHRDQIANEESEGMILRVMDSKRDLGAAFLRTLWTIRSLPEHSPGIC